MSLKRVNDTWIFDLQTRKWKVVTVKISDFYKPRERSGHQAELFLENYMVIFGGM